MEHRCQNLSRAYGLELLGTILQPFENAGRGAGTVSPRVAAGTTRGGTGPIAHIHTVKRDR